MSETDASAPPDAQPTFRELLARLADLMPTADLAKILFPPALGYELLRNQISGEDVDRGGFDPAMPDPELLQAALDLARWLGEYYFYTTVEGGDRVPTDGAALIVANHSAGLMPIDALFAINDIRDRQGPERHVHPLVHDFAYCTATLARYCQRMGILRAGRENAAAALADGRLVMVYPGGDQEAFRPWNERHRIVLAGRRGFLRLALAAGVPIVPLVSVGLHESFIVLSRGKQLAEKLGLKHLVRTDSFPVGLSLPWGIAPSFVPFLPAPTAIDMRFLEPIRLEGDPEDDAIIDAGYEQVESAMQAAMDELAEGRRPWIGRPHH